MGGIGKDNLIEYSLVPILGAFAISLFFSQSGIGIFGPPGLLLLLIWRYGIGVAPERSLPGFLVVAVVIFTADLLLGALISEDMRQGFTELRKYWNVLLCWILFTCPLSRRTRITVTAVFLFAGLAAGVYGVLQYHGIIFKVAPRAHASTHPIHYATNLTFVFGSALLLLVRVNFKRNKMVALLLSTVLAGTFLGMLFSRTRGIWIALPVASIITVFFYNYKKASVFVVILLLASGVAFGTSKNLRHRADTIITAPLKESYRGSVGSRLELWKGSLMIFEDNPLLGTGTGDFREDINSLVKEGKLQRVNQPHAHSIYFEWLATLGALGLVSLLVLFGALLSWGIKGRGGIGGYAIIFATLIIVLGGLTENNLGVSKVFSAYCFTVGLVGAYDYRPKDV